MCFRKVGDKAKIRIVKTGIQDDANIEIISGLQKVMLLRVHIPLLVKI
jgi:hypothetical protein